jgi:hypothetical protein
MPYIEPARRETVLDTSGPSTAGELNFCFSLLAGLYVETQGLSYQTINDIVGALEGAKMEFYRRIAVPYEEQKLKENGDVYDQV